MKTRALISCLIFFWCSTLIANNKWPLIVNSDGYRVTIYPPQPDQLQDEVLSARSAVAVLPPGEIKTAIGVMQLEARAVSDPASQQVALKDFHISEVKFPELSRMQELQYTAMIVSLLAGKELEIPQDALDTMLQLAEHPASGPSEAPIPHTATVQRGTQLEVTYDGPPRFAPIEQTRLHYAENTSYQVLRDGNTYYCADRGIWYLAHDPLGPWETTDQIPDEIQHIPPSSPMYNTRFLYIGDRTNESIHYGFYPGYLQGKHRWGRMGGWGINYESPDYSIQVDPLGGSLYFREKSTTTTPHKKKNWGRDTSKFPEFSK